MLRPQLPLNALRAFEAAARHQNLTRAADELCVSQAALSHQIKALEERLGTVLFQRLPRGVALTDEGAALLPVLSEAFDRIGLSLDRLAGGEAREVLNLGVVGTFATGWLLPRLPAFAAAHPDIISHLHPQQPRRSARRGTGRGDPFWRRRLARRDLHAAVVHAVRAGLRARAGAGAAAAA